MDSWIFVGLGLGQLLEGRRWTGKWRECRQDCLELLEAGWLIEEGLNREGEAGFP